MFKYAVRVEREGEGFVSSLVDWPEVSVSGAGDPSKALKAKLLMAIGKCGRLRAAVPVPRIKPSSPLFVRLSAGESMKVIVLNEVLSNGRDCNLVARELGVSEYFVQQALDLEAPVDVDFLNRILNVVGKRFLAYTTDS